MSTHARALVVLPASFPLQFAIIAIAMNFRFHPATVFLLSVFCAPAAHSQTPLANASTSAASKNALASTPKSTVARLAVNPEDAPLDDTAPNDAATSSKKPSQATSDEKTQPPSDASMPSNTSDASSSDASSSDASSSDASSSDSALAGENFEKPHSLVDYLAFWRSFQDDEAKKIDNGFMRQALLSGVLVALLCSFVGVYVVLKRIVFVSVALAEMSSAGIALGLLLNTARLPPIWCAGFLTLLGVVLFSVHWTPRRVPRESYIGIMYAVAVAAGILLIAKSAQGEGHMLTLLQGDILTVAPAEVRQMMVAFALVALVHAVFHKEFVLVSFDRDQAATLGFRAAWWDFLLFLTIGIVISFSIRAVGILLSTALLILPAVMALLLTRRLRHAFVVAPLVAVLPVPFGLHFSLLRDLPPSALTVALGFGLLVPAMLYSAIKK